MATHSHALALLCRVGGVRLSKSKQTTTYCVREHREGMKHAFGIDTSQDDANIHPAMFCSTCMKVINRSLSKSEYQRCGGGCADPVEWSEHIDNECRACQAVLISQKGGRPAKRKCTSAPPPHRTHSQPSSTTDASTHTSNTSTSTLSSALHEQAEGKAVNGHDQTMEEVLQRATPSYKAVKDLNPERFVANLPSLICSIRNNVIDKAVEVKCCERAYCASCIWQWLGVKASCPVCRAELVASQLLQCSTRRCLAETSIHCDNYLDHLNRCPAIIPLEELRNHVSKCTNTRKHTLTSSTPVAAVLTASPTKLQGDVSDRLTTHLVKSKAVNDVSELRSKGPSQTWTKTIIPKVPSNEASESTIRRRSRMIEQNQQLVCGGPQASVAQQSSVLRRMPDHERQAALQDAGIIPTTPGAGSTLALKADLHMPWYQLRKLKVWLNDFGLHLESERVMRRQLQDQMPFNIVAENAPFKVSGAITLRPMVTIPDLVGTVHHYLARLQATNQLYWHDGAIPDDELWVKVGGDHGGQSFKMSLEIVNVKHPNAVRNVIPFGISLYSVPKIPQPICQQHSAHLPLR